MSKMNQDDVWCVIKSMLDSDKKKYLIKHHIDSFNDFIENKIPCIIKNSNPLSIYHDYNTELNNYKYEIVVNFVNTYYTKPQISENDGSIKKMFPQDARNRNLNYTSTLYVDIEVIVWENPNSDDKKRVSYKEIKGINIADIPIMVKSKYCMLNDFPSDEECKMDLGGYFIVNGNEKVIVCQEKIAENKLFVFKTSKTNSKYSHVSEIKSCCSDGSNNTKNVSIKLLSKENNFGYTLKITIPHVKIDVPVFILFKALGITNDKDIIKYIIYDIDDPKKKEILKWIIPSIEESSVLYTQDEAINYLLKYSMILGQPKDIRLSEERRIELFKGMIERDVLSHVGKNFKKKAFYLGYMIYKLALCVLYNHPYDDRDSYCNKRVSTTGEELRVLFKQYHSKFTKESRNTLMKELNSNPWKNNHSIENIINPTNVNKIFKSTTITAGLKHGLATGNWGKYNSSKVGISQVLSRLTYNSTLSHLRRVNTPTEKTGKLLPPRKLHNTQFGVICAPETPEGGSIGLVKNLAVSTYVTKYSSVSPIIKLLEGRIHQIYDKEKDTFLDFSDIKNKTKVFVNGDWLGISDNSYDLFKYLKSQKRLGVINIYTSIVFNYELNEIHVLTDSGRCMRPLFVVKKNKVTITKSDISKIKSGQFGWNNLLVKTLNENEMFSERESITKPTEEGVIEYVDVEECFHSYISMSLNMDKKGKNQYQYCEIHPSLILGVLSSCIPLLNHNQSPRNTYQSAMGKQAMGIHCTNLKYRMDTMSHLLHYSNKPIVNTRISQYLPSNNLPNGMNVIVAIASYTGYNQEDSILINRQAVERGLFNSTFYRTYREEEKKIHTSGHDDKFIKPDSNITKGMKHGSYAKLNNNGLVDVNTYVDSNDVIIGKVCPIKNKDKRQKNMYKDSSVMLRQNEEGWIDNVNVNVNGEGNKCCKVKVRSVRNPTIGDKLSSRHGQKGTIGMIVNQEDMPFSKDGITPDIIINPHAIPSRMTIAQLVECILGKLTCKIGGYGDGTPFNDLDIKDIEKNLMKNGIEKSGNEILTSGITGQQMDASIFMGPTYYQRLKHMVEDKVHSRAKGPRVLLTRQPPEGRSRDGGLRFGEMERDCMIAHGTMQFLKERTMDVSDNYKTFICNKCNLIAPVNYGDNISKCVKCQNYIDFSEIRVPYACKLMFQELESMALYPRINVE